MNFHRLRVISFSKTSLSRNISSMNETEAKIVNEDNSELNINTKQRVKGRSFTEPVTIKQLSKAKSDNIIIPKTTKVSACRTLVCGSSRVSTQLSLTDSMYFNFLKRIKHKTQKKKNIQCSKEKEIKVFYVADTGKRSKGLIHRKTLDERRSPCGLFGFYRNQHITDLYASDGRYKTDSPIQTLRNRNARMRKNISEVYSFCPYAQHFLKLIASKEDTQGTMTCTNPQHYSLIQFPHRRKSISIKEVNNKPNKAASEHQSTSSSLFKPLKVHEYPHRSKSNTVNDVHHMRTTKTAPYPKPIKVSVDRAVSICKSANQSSLVLDHTTAKFARQKCQGSKINLSISKHSRSFPKIVPYTATIPKISLQLRGIVRYVSVGIIILVWCPCLFITGLGWLLSYTLKLNPLHIKSANKRHDCKDSANKHDNSYINYRAAIKNVTEKVTKVVYAAKSYVVSSIKPKKVVSENQLRCRRCRTHPNPERRYNLYHKGDRGWVIKPLRTSDGLNQRQKLYRQIIHNMFSFLACDSSKTVRSSRSRHITNQNARKRCNRLQTLNYRSCQSPTAHSVSRSCKTSLTQKTREAKSGAVSVTSKRHTLQNSATCRYTAETTLSNDKVNSCMCHSNIYKRSGLVPSQSNKDVKFGSNKVMCVNGHIFKKTEILRQTMKEAETFDICSRCGVDKSSTKKSVKYPFANGMKSAENNDGACKIYPTDQCICRSLPEKKSSMVHKCVCTTTERALRKDNSVYPPTNQFLCESPENKSKMFGKFVCTTEPVSGVSRKDSNLPRNQCLFKVSPENKSSMVDKCFCITTEPVSDLPRKVNNIPRNQCSCKSPIENKLSMVDKCVCTTTEHVSGVPRKDNNIQRNQCLCKSPPENKSSMVDKCVCTTTEHVSGVPRKDNNIQRNQCLCKSPPENKSSMVDKCVCTTTEHVSGVPRKDNNIQRNQCLCKSPPENKSSMVDECVYTTESAPRHKYEGQCSEKRSRSAITFSRHDSEMRYPIQTKRSKSDSRGSLLRRINRLSTKRNRSLHPRSERKAITERGPVQLKSGDPQCIFTAEMHMRQNTKRDHPQIKSEGKNNVCFTKSDRCFLKMRKGGKDVSPPARRHDLDGEKSTSNQATRCGCPKESQGSRSKMESNVSFRERFCGWCRRFGVLCRKGLKSLNNIDKNIYKASFPNGANCTKSMLNHTNSHKTWYERCGSYPCFYQCFVCLALCVWSPILALCNICFKSFVC